MNELVRGGEAEGEGKEWLMLSMSEEMMRAWRGRGGR